LGVERAAAELAKQRAEAQLHLKRRSQLRRLVNLVVQSRAAHRRIEAAQAAAARALAQRGEAAAAEAARLGRAQQLAACVSKSATKTAAKRHAMRERQKAERDRLKDEEKARQKAEKARRAEQNARQEAQRGTQRIAVRARPGNCPGRYGSRHTLHRTNTPCGEFGWGGHLTARGAACLPGRRSGVDVAA
jgi:hypothetical protein